MFRFTKSTLVLRYRLLPFSFIAEEAVRKK